MSPHKALVIAPRAALSFSKCSLLFQEHPDAGSQSGAPFLLCELGVRRPPLFNVFTEEAFSAGVSPIMYKVWGCTLPFEHCLGLSQTHGTKGSCAQTQGPICRSCVKVRNPKVLAMWVGRTWATDETDPHLCYILVAVVTERLKNSMTSELCILQDYSSFNYQKTEAQKRKDHS